MFLTPQKLVNELYLKIGSKVADVGCGGGAYTIALSRAVSDIGQVYALDVHREMLNTLTTTLAKNNILNVDVVWADVEKETHIESYSLDAVVLSNTLFQLENIDLAMKNISKILKPGGQLLVVEWSGSHSGAGPHPSQVVNEEKAESLITKNNFRIEKRLPAGKYHYALIARSN